MPRRCLLMSVVAFLVLAGHPAAALPRDQAAPCTLVELRPGYPGYRGFVTGLYGAGETACLEDLVRLYPWFDHLHEDRENRQAARRLGLAGPPEVWVWESWLGIEAERGLVPACYLDAYRRLAAGEPHQQVDVAPNDPRLLVGTIGSREWVFRAAAANGLTLGMVGGLFPTDYALRAVVWARMHRTHANAWQLQRAAESMFHQFTIPLTIPGRSVPVVAPLARAQGGYVPVPPSACPEDQIFISTATMATMSLVDSGPGGSAMFHQFESVSMDWLVARARGSTASLREYLIAQMPDLP